MARNIAGRTLAWAVYAHMVTHRRMCMRAVNPPRPAQCPGRRMQLTCCAPVHGGARGAPRSRTFKRLNIWGCAGGAVRHSPIRGAATWGHRQHPCATAMCTRTTHATAARGAAVWQSDGTPGLCSSCPCSELVCHQHPQNTRAIESTQLRRDLQRRLAAQSATGCSAVASVGICSPNRNIMQARSVHLGARGQVRHAGALPRRRARGVWARKGGPGAHAGPMGGHQAADWTIQAEDLTCAAHPQAVGPHRGAAWPHSCRASPVARAASGAGTSRWARANAHALDAARRAAACGMYATPGPTRAGAMYTPLILPPSAPQPHPAARPARAPLIPASAPPPAR